MTAPSSRINRLVEAFNRIKPDENGIHRYDPDEPTAKERVITGDFTTGGDNVPGKLISGGVGSVTVSIRKILDLVEKKAASLHRSVLTRR